MANTLEILHQRRADLLELARKYGVSNVRVFGSVARGEERPDSDVDLLIGMEEGRDLFDAGGFQMDATDLLGKFVHISFENGLHRLIRDHVLAEARPI